MTVRRVLDINSLLNLFLAAHHVTLRCNLVLLTTLTQSQDPFTNNSHITLYYDMKPGGSCPTDEIVCSRPHVDLQDKPLPSLQP